MALENRAIAFTCLRIIYGPHEGPLQFFFLPTSLGNFCRHKVHDFSHMHVPGKLEQRQCRVITIGDDIRRNHSDIWADVDDDTRGLVTVGCFDECQQGCRIIWIETNTGNEGQIPTLQEIGKTNVFYHLGQADKAVQAIQSCHEVRFQFADFRINFTYRNSHQIFFSSFRSFSI